MARRVVVDATSIGGRLGGIGVYGVNLVRALARTAVDFDLTIVLNENARPHFPWAASSSRIEFRWVASAFSPDRGSLGHLRRWLHAHRLALRRRHALFFAASQIEATLIGRSRVVMVHDLIPLLFPQWHPRQRFFFRYVLGAALRGAAAVVAPSRVTRDRLVEHYGLAAGRIRVIPHGVPVPRRTGPRVGSTEVPVILGFGGGGPVKNVQTLIHAFRRIENLVPHRLVIVGDRRRPGRGPATAASPRVAFTSWVSEDEKLALLDRATALVCPSLDEGFGFPPLEAMARGCPVVASRLGSLPEVCADAALYVDPRDAEGIASALLSVLSHERLREMLVERGARRAAMFDWDASAAEHIRLFREVMAARDLERASRWPAAALDATSSPGVALQGRDQP